MLLKKLFIYKNKLFLNIFLLITCLTFTIQSYAITENEYIKINKLIEIENIDKAFDELKFIQSKETKLSAKTQILIGKIYLAIEQPTKAFKYFNKATFTSVTTDDLAYAGMSLSSIKLGNLSDAKIYAEKALKENPDSIDGQIALGLIFSDYGEIDKSKNHFQKAILSSHNSLFAVRKYATSEMRLGNNKKAKAIIKNALMNKNADAPTIDLLGKLLWIEGNFKEAIKLRTDASVMFRKSGNTARAEQILIWLNTSASDKLEAIVEEKVQPKVSEVKPKMILKDRKVYKPKGNPERIKINKNKDIYTGSGVIFNHGKWIITNRHVIKGTKYISVRNGLGKVRTVRSVKYPHDKKIDLALLVLSKPYPKDYSQSIQNISSPKVGEKIFVMGYPISSIIGRYNPSITQGIISKNRGFGEKPGEFQITATMNLGNSGGPIFNNKGKIVGISVAKLDKNLILNQKGFIPQDVNVGISADILNIFLNQKNKVSINSNKKDYNATEIYQFMRPSVVFIVGQ